MPIQILGLRKFWSKEKNAEITFDAFFDKGWRASSVPDLFANIEKHLAQIPEDQRWNLYYTCADCKEEKGRKMISQQVIPFDVDGIDVDRRREYIPVVCKALQIIPENTGILYSGNGLQFIVYLRQAFESVKYFEQNRSYYQALCARATAALEAAGLPGKLDPSVFSSARIMRLPLTLNKKPGKIERMGELYYRDLKPVSFDLGTASGLPVVPLAEQIRHKYPAPDTKAVLSECNFLKWAAAEPQNVPENLWYGMLSITARLEDGNKLSHDLSAGHPKYSHAECETKIDQALASSGPRTCVNINKLWGKCSTCPHFEKITSPILIRGEDYIGTMENGFHDFATDKNGLPKPGRPNFEDLRRYFQKQTPYITLIGSKIAYAWDKTHWKQLHDTELENFAYKHFRPFVKSEARKEFRDLVCVTNPRSPEWFSESTHKKINFRNGVLDLNAPEKGLQPHSQEYGFRHTLPYDYDANAKAPRFTKFLNEVTVGDESLQAVLLEFAGYCFSNDDCWAAKTLILTGDGANGKSTFLNVLFSLAGQGNYSVLSLESLRSETSRQALDGKLFNASEETPTYSLMDSSAFKNCISGGMIQMRQLYKTAYIVHNRTKFVFACNELPVNRDTSQGLFRRLLIVPFTAVFEGSKRDSKLQDKLTAELPGIFNMVLNGFRNLEAQKEFTHSQTIIEQVRDYRTISDMVEMFVTDTMTVNGMSEEHVSRVSMLYSNFKFFSEERGFKPENFNTFAKRLRRLIPDFELRYFRKKVDGRFEGHLRGVDYESVKSI